MRENVVVIKSEDFAVRVVNIYKIFQAERNEKVMSKQLLRCGTSIGANVAEAQEAQSGSDFLAKLYISLKECRETMYWLKLLHRTDFLTATEYQSIYHDADELKTILTSIIKTKKANAK